MFKNLKVIAASMLLAFAMLVPASAQQLSPSGDDCWTPEETHPVFEEQAFTLMKDLTEDEVANVKRNLQIQYPDIPPENFSFTKMELWDNELDDSVWVVLYVPNETNADEVCFNGTFAQTQEQIDAVMKAE